jgi:hypothetical protein
MGLVDRNFPGVEVFYAFDTEVCISGVGARTVDGGDPGREEGTWAVDV